MVVTMWHTNDKSSVEIKAGDKHKKPAVAGLTAQGALTGLGFLPYIGSRSQAFR